jgi:uncharacterized protein
MAASRRESRPLRQSQSIGRPQHANGVPIRLFANYAKYADDRSRLAAVRPAHWEYDRMLESAGKLALAGPFANDLGGLFVYNAASKQEALSRVEQDPFAVKGVFEKCELLDG